MSEVMEQPAIDATDPAPDLSTLLRPEVLADPYPFYHRLRSHDPVHWSGECWVLTRYADVLAALQDLRLSAAGMGWDVSDLPDPEREVLTSLFRSLSRWMGFLDPPDHTRLRGLVHKAFTPRVIEALRPQTQQIVDNILDAARSAGRMDVIRDLAAPLPVVVIAEMLGLPPGDRERLKRWSDDLAAFVGRFDFPAAELPELARSLLELTAYLRAVMAERRRRPGNDLISGLLTAEEKGDVLDEDELIANCVLLLFAGHETTTDLIGNGLAALLRHPAQLERLRADPSLIGSAVEELLRYDCPAQLTVRVAREEVRIGGKRVQSGEAVTLMLGAANRDPAQFPEPDRLEIARRENPHVAFGHGIHFCLGSALARLEGQIAINAVVRRLPAIRLAAETLEWRPSQALRGLRSLPVVL
jgi:pimeloyl-[acyl-carrier protein] synthase